MYPKEKDKEVTVTAEKRKIHQWTKGKEGNWGEKREESTCGIRMSQILNKQEDSDCDKIKSSQPAAKKNNKQVTKAD